MFYTFYSSNQNVDNHFVQHRNYNFNFAMVILLQTTNGSVPSSYLSTQLSPHLNLVSLCSCYLFEILFLQLLFSDAITDPFKHILSPQKIYQPVHLLASSQPELLHLLFFTLMCKFSTICISIFPTILTICLDILYSQISFWVFYSGYMFHKFFPTPFL